METWLPVLGYEHHYDVSNWGRIRRTGVVAGARVGRILKPHVAGNGYLRLCLRKNGKRASWCVHHVVAAAFLGPRPPGLQINHRDGCKLNCRSSNLEYVSALDNIHHAIAMGLRPRGGTPPVSRGEQNPAAKLKTADVIAILTSPEPNTVLAQRFGVTDVAVSLIRRRKSWQHVTGSLPGFGDDDKDQG